MTPRKIAALAIRHRLAAWWRRATAGPPRKAKEPYVSVYLRKEQILIVPKDKTFAGVLIGSTPILKLPIEVPDADLGRATIESLAKSRENVPSPKQSERKDLAAPMYVAAGVKSWKAFAQNALLVSVSLRDSTIVVSAWENRGPKSGFVPKTGCDITIPTGSDERIGAALRKALARAS